MLAFGLTVSVVAFITVVVVIMINMRGSGRTH